MKIDFVASPGLNPTVFTIAHRIISSNLLDNPKIEPSFEALKLSTRTYLRSMYDIPDIHEKMKKINWNMANTRGVWRAWYAIIKSTKLFNDEILNNLSSDTVLYRSCTHMSDYTVLAHLLKNNVRVVVGGSIAHLEEPESLRNKIGFFYDIPPKLLKNLIFVNGYVRSSTRIDKIVEEWKDCNLGYPDPSEMWDYNQEYNAQYTDFIRGMAMVYDRKRDEEPNFWRFRHMTTMIFKLGYCWWNKCTFCTYPRYYNLDTIGGLDPEYVAERMIRIADSYRSKNIYIFDDYFVFNKKREAVLKILSDHGIRIAIYTGVKLLANQRYAEKVGKYCDAIFVGVESMTDRTLNNLNKGYDHQEVLKAFENVKKFFSHKKSAFIVSYLIFDIMSPNEDEVKTNFERFYNLKRDMLDNGFYRFRLRPGFLKATIFNKDKIIDGKNVVNCSESNEFLGGRSLVKRVFNKLGVEGVEALDNKIFESNFLIPIRRISDDNKPLRSDIDILGEDEIKFLFS
jgi:hypothetical protein